MLVKDLLVMFQAGNEGVCNILGTLSFFSLGVYLLISAEHYFEMSKSDAREAYDVYKYFIKQTDSVVDYLGVARKLHNVVNVPVPNLKHAPTGLVKALEEYLNDPNFEQNRIEYRRSLGVVEGKSSARAPSPGGKSSLSSETALLRVMQRWRHKKWTSPHLLAPRRLPRRPRLQTQLHRERHKRYRTSLTQSRRIISLPCSTVRHRGMH